MLYIYLPVLYYHSNLYITEGAYAGGRGFPLSQRSFLFMLCHTSPFIKPRPCSFLLCVCLCVCVFLSVCVPVNNRSTSFFGGGLPSDQGGSILKKVAQG